MIRHGTRNASPRKSCCGGATLSYQPPQSSQTTKITVDFQSGPLPMAFTTDATHEGPVSEPAPGWSEFGIVGMTHETAGSVPLAASVSTCVSLNVTLFDQSAPYRMLLNEAGVFHSAPPPGHSEP